MSSGFNSDVNVGSDVYHVQTEDHGQPECLIETLVYHHGRIFHRRTSNYSDLAAAPGISEDALRERVETQHRAVIDAVRDGAITVPTVASGGVRTSNDGIQVRLRNASSWLVAGKATLDVQVLWRSGGEPVANANVEANITGLRNEARFSATTGADGLAELRFAMPSLGVNGSELVIRARAESESDEVRYALRSKAKSPPPEAKS
ncbi:MAG: hypothetical protein ACRD4H_10815 [Candidatus Acidiferrales bacterium]